MSHLAVLPSIYPPYTEKCLASMAPEFRERVVVIDNAPPHANRGVAKSWNIVGDRVMEEELDWLVIISAATRFGGSGGMDFLANLEANPDAWVLESGWPSRGKKWVGWHLLAWSRVNVLERIGRFDQNHPAYGEDADTSWRVLVAMEEAEASNVWVKFDVDAWIESSGHGVELAGVQVDHEALWSYHSAKWGGRSGAETFTRPFNDPSLPLSFWPIPPDPRCREHDGWAL